MAVQEFFLWGGGGFSRFNWWSWRRVLGGSGVGGVAEPHEGTDVTCGKWVEEGVRKRGMGVPAWGARALLLHSFWEVGST